MRHRKRRYKLGRKSAHRKATLESLVVSLLRHGRIKTTVHKARAASRLADRLITLAKRADLHATRQIAARIRDHKVTEKLIKEIAPATKERKGGYTRIMRYSSRAGDNAQMAVWELTDYVAPVVTEPAKKKKKKAATDVVKTEEKPKKETGKTKSSESKGEKTSEKKPRGGFLKGLRQFLTGEDKNKE